MASMTNVVCKCCKTNFQARTADVKRGWGKFCSKSCKAKTQEKRTGQYANLIHGKPKRSKRKSSYKPHDGVSPMKYKNCCQCGQPAVNGYHTITGIDWLCQEHFDDYDDAHPFSSDGLGQW